jgi:predicted metalloprotease with PDZ domain
LVVTALATASLTACAEAPLPAPAPPQPPPVRTPDWATPVPVAEAHVLEIRIAPVLAPGATGAAREIDHLDVSLRFSEPPGEFGDPGPLVLTMPEREEGEPGWPEAVEDVYARDAEGALQLRTKPVATDEAHVEWRSDRRPVGAVNVGYRVRLTRGDARRNVGTHANAGGFQGTGATFLLLPEAADVHKVRVAWDLAGAGEGARAVSSFGDGAVEAASSVDRLRAAVFMAGPIGRMSIDEGTTRFEGAWLGRPAFDPVEAIPWAARVRAKERAFFRDADPAPFTFFLRAVPGMGPTWFGSGRPAGFLLVAGEELGLTRTARFAIAHELVHHWIGGERGVRFDAPQGTMYWFTEGFTVHFTRELLLRAGLATPEEAAEDLRERLARHATSAERDLPNDAIGKRFFQSSAVEKVPYDRGMLYAAEVDAAVRARSAGKRSLDDLVLALLDRVRAEPPAADGGAARLPASAWRELVGAELGPEAQARFDAEILRGEAFTPPPGAFGPCFKAEKKGIPRFELGFEVRSFPDKKIAGLRRGSAAERAGLRDGDEIVRTGGAVLGVVEQTIEITVKRAGAEKKVTFQPRGATVDGTLWVRDPHHRGSTNCR